MNDNKYRPLSPWAYFGYQILFSIPFFGFIFLIFCSFSDVNINRRNFARSYFCIYILIFILILVCMFFFSEIFEQIMEILPF